MRSSMSQQPAAQQNVLRSNSESGAALLLSVIVLAILLGFIAWSTLSTTKTALTTAYQINNDNQARVAAMVGITALKQYANGIYQHPNDASNASSSCTQGTGLLGGLLGSLCNITTGVVSGLLGSAGSNTPIPNGGNGGVAFYMHAGTTAQATLSKASPFLGATVSAYVFSNTFQPAGTNPNTASAPGLITIISQGHSGHATATATAVLGVGTTQSSGSSTTNGNLPINLTGNTTFKGNVQLIGGTNTSLVDQGALNAGGSFDGFNTIASTQAITLSGNTQGGNLFSEQDITISGSGSYNAIQSMGNVSLSGSVQAQSIQTNGTTTLNSSASVGSITSIGDVTLGSSTHVSTLNTQGNVIATNASVGAVQVQGSYTETANGSAGSGNVGGSIQFPSWNGNIHLTPTPGLQVPITPLTALTVSVPKFTVSEMAGLANFAFSPPPSGADPTIQATVVVNHVNNITAGTYYLYDNSFGKNDYLCSTYHPGTATWLNPLPSKCIAKIANGYSDYNPNITYSEGTWTLSGTTRSTSDIVPGVLWFSGNLNVANGTYYNSMLATGNITTSGNSQVYAVNYAYGKGYNVCANNGYITINSSNFCRAGSTSYNPASIGNVALLAGGDVNLGASINVYGDVIAGDIINTTGSSTIYGYLTSAGSAGGENQFGGATTVNVQNLPSTFTPTIPGSWSNTAPIPAVKPQIMLKSIYWQ